LKEWKKIDKDSYKKKNVIILNCTEEDYTLVQKIYESLKETVKEVTYQCNTDFLRIFNKLFNEDESYLQIFFEAGYDSLLKKELEESKYEVFQDDSVKFYGKEKENSKIALKILQFYSNLSENCIFDSEDQDKLKKILEEESKEGSNAANSFGSSIMNTLCSDIQNDDPNTIKTPKWIASCYDIDLGKPLFPHNFIETEDSKEIKRILKKMNKNKGMCGELNKESKTIFIYSYISKKKYIEKLDK